MKPKINLMQPCNDCPFRVKSVPSWLGPWNAKTLHCFVMSEQPFSCHQTVAMDDQPAQETELCVGSILYMNKNCKKARLGWLRTQQERFKRIDTSGILSTPAFFEHHKEGVLEAVRRRTEEEGEQ